jgi:tetratricopeptide (TPR) repeat protein
VGDLQGRPNFANLGDGKGALASYGKAVAQLRALDAAHPGDPLVRRDLAAALHRTGAILTDTFHDPARAVPAEREALSISEALVDAAPDNIDALRVLLNVNTKFADMLLANGKSAEALAAYEKALPRYEALLQRTGVRNDRFNYAIAHSKVGTALRNMGRGAEAVAALQRGRDILQSLAQDGHDVKSQRSLSVVLNYIGDLQTEAGDYRSAVACYREALALREALAPADPRNALARADLVGSYLRIGDALLRDHDDDGAAREYARALAITVAIEARDKGEVNPAADRAGEARMGEIEARRGRPAAALARYETAIPRLEAAHRASLEDVDDKYDLAVAVLGRARSEVALAAAGRSREAWQKARASYATTLDLWRTIDGHSPGDSRLEAGPLGPNLKAAQDGLARCDEALRRLAGR